MFSIHPCSEVLGHNDFDFVSGCVSESNSSDQGENDRVGVSSEAAAARRPRDISSSLGPESRAGVTESAAGCQILISRYTRGLGLLLT